jgi:hypothetical protein
MNLYSEYKTRFRLSLPLSLKSQRTRKNEKGNEGIENRGFKHASFVLMYSLMASEESDSNLMGGNRWAIAHD